MRFRHARTGGGQGGGQLGAQGDLRFACKRQDLLAEGSCHPCGSSQRGDRKPGLNSLVCLDCFNTSAFLQAFFPRAG